MNDIIYLYVFLIGICIGSFLNVVIDRLPFGKKLFIDRSKCDFCHKILQPVDLIPVFSWIFLKGRCRYCKKFFGYKYLIIEILTGLLFILATWNVLSNYRLEINNYRLWVHLIFNLLINSILIIIFFTDFFYGIIPDEILVFGFIASLFFEIVLKFNLINSFLGGFLSFIFFFLIFILTKRRGMGFGDVKFSVFIGFLLGILNGFLAFYLAFLTGAIVALILIVCKKKSLKKDAIAFGPFLAFSTLIFYLWGAQLQIIFFKILSL